MNPHQKNKIDVNSLSPEEQRLFRLYGKLPSRTDHIRKNFQDRKYFDSGDYALEKAGKGDGVDTGNVGSEHPVLEHIRHNSVVAPPVPGHNGSISGPSSTVPVGSPAKESSLQRETSVEEAGAEDEADNKDGNDVADGTEAAPQGIPIRNS